jgi:SagB-type dehydrogenase family enzyme
MIPDEDVASLALLYHLNSGPWNGEQPEADPSRSMQFKEVNSAASPVILPKSRIDTPVMKAILARRSCRSYGAGTLGLADLAEILRAAYGMAFGLSLPGAAGYPPRSVPSAGGFYPLEVYVAAGAVGGVGQGLYHYGVLDHSLELLRPGEVLAELGGVLLHQHSLSGACAVIIFTSVFRRTLDRYGARGYRYVLLEAGHAAQNICLVATEMGLGTLCVGGFFDARLNQLLGVDGLREAAIYCVAIGFGPE